MKKTDPAHGAVGEDEVEVLLVVAGVEDEVASDHHGQHPRLAERVAAVVRDEDARVHRLVRVRKHVQLQKHVQSCLTADVAQGQISEGKGRPRHSAETTKIAATEALCPL